MVRPTRTYSSATSASFEKAGIKDRVQILGLIPKRDQIELLKHSCALIQPTLFEGGPGGGAVYEAFSLRVPAIVSDIPINRELPADDLHHFFPGGRRRRFGETNGGTTDERDETK